MGAAALAFAPVTLALDEPGAPPLAPAQLIELARGDGLVFLTTHADATLGTDEVRDANADTAFLADCARQRALNDEGREHARTFGRALARLGVVFASVAVSPYCRARETVELALPGRAFDVDADLRSICFASAVAMRERRAALLRRLAAPATGNVLLVTHFCNVSTFARATLDWCGLRLAPGTSIVYRAGAGEPTPLGCIAAETWRSWGTDDG